MSDNNTSQNNLSIKHTSELFTSKAMVKVIHDEIAVRTTLNESIMLGQINYWLQKNQDSKHFRNGRYWVWKTYEEWSEELPFWSVSTIRNIIRSLKKRGIVIVGDFNKMSIDKTTWYTIDYDFLDEFCQSDIPEKKNRRYKKEEFPCVKNEQSMCQELTDGCVKNEQMDVSTFDTPITLEYSKNTTKNTKTKNPKEWSDFDKAKNRSPYFRLKERLENLIYDDKELAEMMEDVISYFFSEYEELKGSPHEYIVSDEHFYEPTRLVKTVAYELGYNSIIDIINQYFKDFPDTVWDYRHFGTEKILRIRMYKLGYGEADVISVLGVETYTPR